MELNDLFSSILVFFQENYQCKEARIILLLNENASNKELILKTDTEASFDEAVKFQEVIVPIYFEGALQANLILKIVDTSVVNLNIKLIQGLLSPLVTIWKQNLKERKELLSENIRLQKELKDKFRPHNMIGTAKSIETVFELSAQVSQSDATVLLLGESGVGKELFASAIHYNSDRASESFVKVNCAALTESLLESELFGHEKGAFTGATQLKKGRFEQAEKGTIFLDEIGDISPNVQVKLLRILQEKEFERVGGTKTLKANVRILAATNKNLEELITKGLFREDLYYRLNVFPIKIPPLRERKSDIASLVNFFIEKYAKEFNRPIKTINQTAMKLLISYNYPGNIRELQNYIERAVLLAKSHEITEEHLPITLKESLPFVTTSSENELFNWRAMLSDNYSLDDILTIWEKEIIETVLAEFKGNMTKSAQYLKLTNRIMGLRVKQFNLNKKGDGPKSL